MKYLQHKFKNVEIKQTNDVPLSQVLCIKVLVSLKSYSHANLKIQIFFIFQICLRRNGFNISKEETIASHGGPFLTILLLTLLTDAYTFRMNKTSLDIPIKATSISCITNIVFMSALGKETAEKYFYKTFLTLVFYNQSFV